MITLQRTNSDNPDFRQLIKLLDADLWQRYGQEQASYDGYNVIDYLDTVVIAYDAARTAVGCACFKEWDTHTVELKRMFVLESKRGQGIATAIIHELEQWAKNLGYPFMILETGIKQAEALKLYPKMGYVITANYGQYIDMPGSVCMRKEL